MTKSAQAADLCVVLLTPPLTSGTRTIGAVRRGAKILGHENFQIANLMSTATQHARDAALVGADEKPWMSARAELRRGMRQSKELLLAWGVLRHLGPARRHAESQVQWLLDVAEDSGHLGAWSVGHDVRHPSRWHQFTADRHGRTEGGDGIERLRQVLAYRELDELRRCFLGGTRPDS